jgi:LysR family carnitine catabolism transcriptional activator
LQINQSNVSVRDLRAFTALAAVRNFTRAAKECNLSQPAFSALIRALEESVGARLFDRDTRKVELTAEGQRFLESATRLLQDFGLALTDLRDLATRRRGRVAVAVLPSLAAGWLPDVLAEFHRAHPGIELDVADALADECIDRVRAGKADFALASSRATSSELTSELFCADRFHFVCRRDHALAGRRRVTLQQLGDEPFVHLARSSSVRQHVDQALWPGRARKVMELEQLSTVAGMVRAGLGITVVPALTLFHFRHPDLATVPLDAPGMVREIFLLRSRDRGLSIAARSLYELCVQRKPPMRGRRPAE